MIEGKCIYSRVLFPRSVLGHSNWGTWLKPLNFREALTLFEQLSPADPALYVLYVFAEVIDKRTVIAAVDVCIGGCPVVHVHYPGAMPGEVKDRSALFAMHAPIQLLHPLILK